MLRVDKEFKGAGHLQYCKYVKSKQVIQSITIMFTEKE